MIQTLFRCNIADLTGNRATDVETIKKAISPHFGEKVRLNAADLMAFAYAGERSVGAAEIIYDPDDSYLKVMETKTPGMRPFVRACLRLDIQ